MMMHQTNQLRVECASHGLDGTPVVAHLMDWCDLWLVTMP